MGDLAAPVCCEQGTRHVHHVRFVSKPSSGVHLKRFEKILDIFERENHSTRTTSPSRESICNAKAKALAAIQKEIQQIIGPAKLSKKGIKQ